MNSSLNFMKNLAVISTLVALASICLMNCAEENKVVGPGGKKPIVVPKGKTYVVLNAKRKEIRRYSAGQVMAEETTVDCVKIACPSTFPPNYVCWQCKARIPEPTASPGPAKAE